MEFLEVEPGIEIGYVDVGPVNARPVVLLHAWAFDHSIWDHQIRAFSDDYRVISVDLRGHGASSKPAAGYEADRMAADVLALLDHLDLREVALIGWSFGGAVSARVAATTSRVDQLVLVAPFGPKYLADETTTYSLTAEQIAGVTEAERTGPLQLRKASVAGMPKEPYAPEVLEWLYGLTLKAPSWSAGRALTAIMYEDFRGDLGNIKVPTLILHGKADQNAPALGSEEYQRGIEQAKIYWFEESGHSPSIEEADHFNSVVSEFLQRRGHADAPDTAKVEQASR